MGTRALRAGSGAGQVACWAAAGGRAAAPAGRPSASRTRRPWREQQQGGGLERPAAVAQQAYEGVARALLHGRAPASAACPRSSSSRLSQRCAASSKSCGAGQRGGPLAAPSECQAARRPLPPCLPTSPGRRAGLEGLAQPSSPGSAGDAAGRHTSRTRTCSSHCAASQASSSHHQGASARRPRKSLPRTPTPLHLSNALGICGMQHPTAPL
jgi:hypothetical protein